MGDKGLREFMHGHITVKVEVLNPEKFINMAVRYGIKIWEIRRINFTTIEFKMNSYQYRRIKIIAKKTGSKVKITSKYGVHFLLGKAVRRKFFIIGFIVFVGLIFYFSSIVWKIEITGNKKIETARIYDALHKAGLTEGRLKYNIKLREIENAATREIEEISMLNIRFTGTHAKVEVVERTMPPKPLPLNSPGNIVAVRDGIIKKIIALRGQAVVKENQIVKKGEILISGIVTDVNKLPIGITHAMGEVTAETWYEDRQEVQLNYTYETRTGKVSERTYIMVMGKRVYLKNEKINFDKYDKIEEKSIINIKGYELPVEKVTEYYFEKEVSKKTLTYEEAVEIGINKAEENIKKQMTLNMKIKDKIIEKSQADGVVNVRVMYVAEENIGQEQEIK
jgi:similar to stage IV sporulation protein